MATDPISVARALDPVDVEFMGLAIAEARSAIDHGDVPIGAVAVLDGRILASRHNQRELLADPTAHAEVLAVRDAAAALGRWRLDGVTVYVTLEPCAMCAGALLNARVDRVVFGARSMENGACGSLLNLGADPRLNHEFVVVPDVCGVECAQLLSGFFDELR